MQNPVTGSGGMLLGEVAQVGPRHPDARRLSPGDPIASLVSLTLTPLHLEEVGAIHASTERVEARGTAILFARTLWARLPDDFPEPVALAVFDVAGAPASVARHARPGQTVLVDRNRQGGTPLARRRPRGGGAPRARPRRRALGGRGGPRARAGLRRRRRIDRRARSDRHARGGRGGDQGGLADLVVNVANAGGTEAASVLCAKDDGAVLFFGMATSFSAAARVRRASPSRRRSGSATATCPATTQTALGLLRRHDGLRAGLRRALRGP